MSIFPNPPIKYLVIHHTAVTRASGRNQFDAVNTYHKNKNWGTAAKPWYQPGPSALGYYVGYNYFIDVDGKLTQTRAIGEETIAQNGHNCDVLNRCDAISICVAGDFNMELLNDAQILRLREHLRLLQEKYPATEIVFHSDLQKGRTCAGKLFTKDYLRTRILEEGIPKPDKEDAVKQKEIAALMEQVSLWQQVLALLLKLRGK